MVRSIKVSRAERTAPLKDDAVAAKFVREHLHYDSETGLLTNRTTRSSRARPGALATREKENGYLVVSLLNAAYLAHRVAWLHYYGTWPKNMIDHMNGDRKDNRISNLRDVPTAVNNQNRGGPQRNSKSGFLGVWYAPHRGKFMSRIRVNGKLLFLGYFTNAEDAHAAYIKAKNEKHSAPWMQLAASQPAKKEIA